MQLETSQDHRPCGKFLLLCHSTITEQGTEQVIKIYFMFCVIIPFLQQTSFGYNIKKYLLN